MTPRVRNKKEASGGVFIGRPSRWGNPFKIGRDGSRLEVIQRYREWIQDGQGPSINDIQRYLRGKDLVCYCAPESCHGDVLLEIANAAPTPKDTEVKGAK